MMVKARMMAATAMILVCSLILAGCWDRVELDSLLIVTGVALDKSDKDNEIDIMLEIGKPKAKASSSTEASDQQEKAVLLLKTTNESIGDGIAKLNRDSSRSLLLQHNQVVLFGMDLAQSGVINKIDLFLRSQDTRMEVLMAVVDGRAEDMLKIEPELDAITGMYLSRMMKDMSDITKNYRVRLIDFVSRLLSGTTAPVLPIINQKQMEKEKKIVFAGIAVFGQDKMVGKLTEGEAEGYIWAMGNVRQWSFASTYNLDRAIFQMIELDSKRDVTLLPNGGVHVSFEVNADLAVNELDGFNGLSLEMLSGLLNEMAKDTIRQKIINTFQKAQELNADIYGIGQSVQKKYPKEWNAMKGQWTTLFPKAELDVSVNADIHSMGQIMKSMEMEVR